MSVVPRLTFRALGPERLGRLPAYAATLRAACAAHPPPFGQAWYGDRFRRLARDPAWVARSLLVNAAAEGQGARRLWRLAGRAADPAVAEQIRRHALDESGHALLYLAMLDTVFPAALPARRRPAVRRLSPGYRAADRPPAGPALPPWRLLDALVQMNLGEIRTRINMLLMRPVLVACCPPAGRRRLGRMVHGLLADETRHIGYTAALIEAAAARGRAGLVRRTLERRLAQFNALTVAEVGAAGRRDPCRG